MKFIPRSAYAPLRDRFPVGGLILLVLLGSRTGSRTLPDHEPARKRPYRIIGYVLGPRGASQRTLHDEPTR